MQVYIYDENKIYLKTDVVEELAENMTTVSPLSSDKTGTIPHRPRFDEENQVWVEDMTDEEIKAWEESNKTDICPTKTLEERVEELEQENKLLKQENKMLSTQVEATTQNQEFIESCMMEMAGVVYA